MLSFLSSKRQDTQLNLVRQKYKQKSAKKNFQPPKLISVMEKQEFISSLMDIANSVQVEEGEECIICKEEYGTTSSETGKVERKIRLPCNKNHTVGSNCIETWLNEHLTCPICRHEFFERDYSESGVGYVDEDEDYYWDDDDTSFIFLEDNY